MASVTTAGEGGKGTFEANDKFDSAEARGVRTRAARERVVAGSTSESSLEECQQTSFKKADAHPGALLTSQEVPLQLLSPFS